MPTKNAERIIQMMATSFEGIVVLICLGLGVQRMKKGIKHTMTTSLERIVGFTL